MKKIHFDKVVIGVIELVLAILTFWVSFRYRAQYPAYTNAVILIGILLMAAILVSYFLYEHKIEFHKIVFVIGILMGFIYSIYLPLGSVPDEPIHYDTAYIVSNYMMGHPDVHYKRQCDKDFEDAIYYDTVKDNDKYYTKFVLPTGDTKIIKARQSVHNTFPFQYCIPALGIVIGRLLHLNTLWMFMLGRWFNHVFFWIVAALAVKYMPVCKMGMFALLLLPMSLQQTMSFSYDVSIIAASMLIIALSIYFYVNDYKDTKWQEWALLAGACMLLLPQKSYAYLMVVLFPFMLLVKKALNDKNKKYLAVGLATIAFTVFAYIMSHRGGGGGLVTVRDGYFNPSYVKTHLLHSAVVMFKSVVVCSGEYVSTLVGSSLCWFRIGVPTILVEAFMIILFVCFLKRRNETTDINGSVRITSLIVFIGTVGIVMLGMLLSWTKVTDNTIQGVQGRYITPAFPALGILLYSKKIEVDESIDRWLVLTLVVLHAILILTTCNRF